MSEGGFNSELISRLRDSFGNLERAISGARSTLEKNQNVPKSFIDRLDSYEEILSKQRLLARSLDDLVQVGGFEQIAQHVKVINSLSGMIIDDAKNMLASLSTSAPLEDMEPDYTKNIC